MGAMSLLNVTFDGALGERPHPHTQSADDVRSATMMPGLMKITWLFSMSAIIGSRPQASRSVPPAVAGCSSFGSAADFDLLAAVDKFSAPEAAPMTLRLAPPRARAPS
jgi:hypothetical protein